MIADRLTVYLRRNQIAHERTNAWESAERMLYADHGQQEVEAVMEWAMADEFWRERIRSVPWFRTKYLEIRQQAARDTDLVTDDDKDHQHRVILRNYRRTLERAVEYEDTAHYTDPRPAFNQHEIDALVARKERELNQ